MDTKLRNIIWTVALLFLFLTACSNRRDTVCELSGIVPQIDPGQTVYLTKLEDRINFRSCLNMVDSATVENDSTFSIQWENKQPGWFEVCGQEGWSLLPNPVYVRPGDKIRITTASDRDQPPIWSGAFETFYPFYRAAVRMEKTNRQELYGLPPDSFRHVMNFLLNTQKKILDQYAAEGDSLAPLVSHASAWLDYRYAATHFDYLKYHNYYAKDTFLHFHPNQPEFFSFLDTVQLATGRMRHIPEYQLAVNGYLDHGFEVRSRNLSDSMKWEKELPIKAQIVTESWAGPLQDAGFQALLSSPFALEHPQLFEIADSVDRYFKSATNDPLSYQKFRFLLEAFNRLRPGNLAPPLSLPDTAGLLFALDSLRGQVVYLDFWGTWCFPCLQELPNSLALMDTFANAEVAFVFVGLETGQEAKSRWRDFVTGRKGLDYAAFLPQRRWPGTHLLAEGQFGNPAIREFLISYAPSYMLIGPDGRILKARAPRPGNPEIVSLIKQSLPKQKCLTCPD